ncbi:MAG: hypothetical protein HC893_04295 [Chloroflexaceae bacterium]|nr:hypothetical protein [Chloroflexaceae bacterium]NJL33204.1 hypothetical protein [Chloroflexaceae bacterium]NJO06097.1 hypothetical protein [Chloroflexaceae bacterium]
MHSRLARYCTILVAVLLIVVALPAVVRAEPGIAKVYATLRANPNVGVAPGGEIAYAIEARNVDEQTDAPQVRVTFSYNPEMLTPAGTAFEVDRDYIEEIAIDSTGRATATVVFADLDNLSSRTAILTMTVASDLPEFTVIDTFATWTWIDAQGTRAVRDMNNVPILVLGGPVHSNVQWMTVAPSAAPVGTQRTFFSDRFMPDETVVFWVNQRDGTTLPVNLERATDDRGRFELRYTPDLPPGEYQLVASGLDSGVVATADFIVQ